MSMTYAPYNADPRSSSRFLPSLSPNKNAPAEPARAPNNELLTTNPDWKDDSEYLHKSAQAMCRESENTVQMQCMHACMPQPARSGVAHMG